MNNAVALSTVQTMTTREIAELTSKRHDNVKSSINNSASNSYSEQNHKSKIPGFIYVLESSDGSAVKIGRSQTPMKRLHVLRKVSNSNGNAWVSKLQDNSSWLESMCHKYFKDKRTNGEWFLVKLSAVVDYIEATQQPQDK